MARPSSSQTAVPCTIMRGGTSKGLYFLASDLPEDDARRDAVLLAAMGSPDRRQVDGLGGADTLTSKVAIVSPGREPGIDVEYRFAQVSVDKPQVDTSPSCGNILAGVGPFAVESGLVAPGDPETVVVIRDVNIGARIESRFATPGGQVRYDGDCAVDGVPGTASPVRLVFRGVTGGKTGRLFPTGREQEEIDGVPCTCIDAAVPVLLIPAAALGRCAQDGRDSLNADRGLLERLEAIRRQAGERMGLGDVSQRVIPKVSLVGAPAGGGTIASRYFTPWSCHSAHALTGAVAVAAASLLAGTVAAGVAANAESEPGQAVLEHPGGKIALKLKISGRAPDAVVEEAVLVSTTRLLMRGHVYVPARIWEGKEG